MNSHSPHCMLTCAQLKKHYVCIPTHSYSCSYPLCRYMHCHKINGRIHTYVHAVHTDTHKGLIEGPYTDWEHKTLSNEIQFCGHGAFPREKSLEKVQRSQSEFIIRGKFTYTHQNTHTRLQRKVSLWFTNKSSPKCTAAFKQRKSNTGH